MTEKSQLIKLIAFILLLAIVMFSFLLVYDNIKGQFPDITQASFNYNHGYTPVDYDYWCRLSERIKPKYVSFTSEGWRFTIKDAEVTPVYTTFSYFDLNKTEFLYGKGFGEAQQYAAQPLAVISESLAFKLYFTKDVVGESIDLDGRLFTVCGVIKDKSGLINIISEDHKERVYLPCTCAPHPKDILIDTIVYDTDSNSAAIVEQMDLPQYYFFSLTEKAKVIETLCHLLFLVLFICLSVLIGVFSFRLSKHYLRSVSENLKDNYFIKSLCSVPVSYLLLVFFSLGIPILLAFVFIKSDFSIYIVPEYIPYDNIFDFNYYYNAWLQSNSQVNNLALAGCNYYFQLYELTFSTQLWLLIIFVVVLVITCILLFEFISNRVGLLSKNHTSD